jgi:predicted nucleic acid-binding protein
LKHLLDVNVLLAAAHANHPDYTKAAAWLPGKSIVLCPIVELGFLRISTMPRTFSGLSMADARRLLQSFSAYFNAEWIPDDLAGLESKPPKWDAVSDHYLCDLAHKHGFKLATLDQDLKHPVAELIH